MYLGTKFAVASESYLATRAGYEVYKAGATPLTRLWRPPPC